MIDLHQMLMDPTPVNREWIEDGILQKGSVFLFGGGSGIGKSFIILNTIRSLVEGSNWLGTEWRVVDRPKSILYLDAEVGPNLMAQRVKKVFGGVQGFKPGIVHVDCDTSYVKLDTERGRAALEEKIDACEVKPDIVIIDPLSYFMESGDGDNTVAGHVYDTIRRIQKKHNEDMTFIISHHYRKKPTGRGLEQYDPLDLSEFRGAGQWAAMAWTAMTLDRKQDNNDGGWDLEAAFPKIRASKPISGRYYFKMDGETMRVWPKTQAQAAPRNATWG